MLFRRLAGIVRSHFNHAFKDRDMATSAYWEENGSKEQQSDLGAQNFKDERLAEYYRILELQDGASFAEIKKQYLRLMGIYHPDMFENDSEKRKIAHEVSIKINEAFRFFEMEEIKRKS